LEKGVGYPGTPHSKIDASFLRKQEHGIFYVPFRILFFSGKDGKAKERWKDSTGLHR
jgi:hypothetical protein